MRAACRLTLLVLAVTSLAGFSTSSAQPPLPQGRLTVLIWHPNDGADPLGFAIEGSGLDGFRERYAGDGFYDYPLVIVDGVLEVEGLPGNRSLGDTMKSYGQAADSRRPAQSPGTLRLESQLVADGIEVSVSVDAADTIPPGLTAWVAVAEDPVHLRPLVSNGVFDHRFTVRAAQAVGAVPSGGPSWNATTVIPLDPDWRTDRILVAAWLQHEDLAGARFEPREVVQATHAALGQTRTQIEKGVLIEMLSATWCDPCLIGDKAAEALAVAAGAAEPLPAPEGLRYLRAPERPLLAVALAGVGAALALAWVRRPAGVRR